MLVNINKVLGMIGLATKAGAMKYGADVVEENIKKGKAKIVIIAKDASQRTKNNFEMLCQNKNIPFVVLCSKEEISKAIGKTNKAVITIINKSFSDEIKKIIFGGEAIE